MGNNIVTQGTLILRDLIVLGKHGASQPERDRFQRFKITCSLQVNLVSAVKSDNLNDTINWSNVRKQIISVVQDNSFNLMEHLASRICEDLAQDKRIQKISLLVEKPDAYNDCTPSVSLDFINQT
jgi:dihydroneopterin aldolase